MHLINTSCAVRLRKLPTELSQDERSRSTLLSFAGQLPGVACVACVARPKRSVGVRSLAIVSSDSHALRASERATRAAAHASILKKTGAWPTFAASPCSPCGTCGTPKAQRGREELGNRF